MARLVESTRLCARILGPFLAATGAAAVLRRDELPILFDAFRDDSGLTFATGVFVLLVGLAVLATHHRWRAPAEIAVSLIGWLLALRGALLIFAPGVAFDLADRALKSAPLALVAGLCAVGVGVWLTLAGYRRAAG